MIHPEKRYKTVYSTVQYYDIDQDKLVEKELHSMEYGWENVFFSFVPIDNPPKIYKSVIIQHPVIKMVKHADGDNILTIYVTGWQCVKSGGYSKTVTTIRIVETEYFI